MKEDTTIQKHVSEFNSIAAQLRSLKINLDEEVLCLLLSSSLPPNWDTLVTTVTNIVGNKFKQQDVVASLLNEETRKALTKMSTQSNQALSAGQRGRSQHGDQCFGSSNGRSQRQLDDSGLTLTFGKGSWKISRGCMMVLRGQKDESLYILHGTTQKNNYAKNVVAMASKLEDMHIDITVWVILLSMEVLNCPNANKWQMTMENEISPEFLAGEISSVSIALQPRFWTPNYAFLSPDLSSLSIHLPMSSLRPDLTGKIWPLPEPSTVVPEIDHFDRLPDPLLLLLFNKIGDVKALGRCSVLSRRFHDLVPQVDNVVVRVDCVISGDEASSSGATSDKSRGIFSNLVRLFVGGIVKPLQALGQFLGPKKLSSSAVRRGDGGGESDGMEPDGVSHHSPTQVLKNFNEIRSLRIELPSGELGIEDGVLVKWRANFGSTLENCVILGASSVIYPGITKVSVQDDGGIGDENGGIPESFYTNGGLKLRVVWTISSLIAASARHYLLRPIIDEHRTLDSLVFTDADGQGVLCMNREQLEELRVKPLSASTASKRTLVPALNMRLWYAPHLELPDGVVLKGATLVAVRPSEQTMAKKEISDGSWVSTAFEEPYGMAAKLLVKRRTYCLEMNSF
ncbi:hypothetical protein HHK36_023336 [Tetracentron sinense]|uniref:F-box protein n=1 Tax=Tetracentron sinense TaxID=13715 RepID=A0A835D5S0_TETSI|nr:hypothetical protein HHK36_023336 [Tetracentron sinense]